MCLFLAECILNVDLRRAARNCGFSVRRNKATASVSAALRGEEASRELLERGAGKSLNSI
jgi:hypothetical protein